MNPIAKALRLWHTVRWLKPVQVYGRVRFRLLKPRPDLRPAPVVRAATGAWAMPARREQSLVAPTQMRFLNEERDVDLHGWDSKDLAKLWRYNQHYFDDLCAFGAAERTAWHRELIARWMRECPPGKGTAWEPYPTSLRIVNWIKWLRAGNEPVEGMLDSLAAQARFLTKRLEWHLLGNHLFVNAKALVVAGLFFEGPEADAWRETGWRILRTEIPEQILEDGGQFERSPMYHALAVEDMLDLLNAMRAWPGVSAEPDERAVATRIASMRAFLLAMTHPDGNLGLFNDAAAGVAPLTVELERYARQLGLGELPPLSDGIHAFPSTGMVRLQRSGIIALLDVAPIGPDYLPGHAHADTLSCEISIDGVRILVNTGTGSYHAGPSRDLERSTAAHNTVVLEGRNSSEVYGAFRVARRARPQGLEVQQRRDGFVVRCSHDGYSHLPGSPRHTRVWLLDAECLTVTDIIERASSAVGWWRTALGAEWLGAGEVALRTQGKLVAMMRFRGSRLKLQKVVLHPSFGESIEGSAIEFRPPTAQMPWISEVTIARR